MTLLEELANADVPGAKIRLALMKRGAKAEQERIIKLLEELYWTGEQEAITLIKGENK